MKKLKDYMKLIFTAVVCFFMNFVPRRKESSKEKSMVFGNRTVDTERNGLNEAMTVKKTVSVIERSSVFSIFNKVKQAWQFQRHKLCPLYSIGKPVYKNTG